MSVLFLAKRVRNGAIFDSLNQEKCSCSVAPQQFGTHARRCDILTLLPITPHVVLGHHMGGIRGGDENRSTSAHDTHHFCQRPLRLLKMLKKPLGSYDIKRPLGEPDITLVKVPWLLLPGSFVCNKNDLLLNLVEALLCSIHDQCKSSPQSVHCKVSRYKCDEPHLRIAFDVFMRPSSSIASPQRARERPIV